jgi:hypothetical protein
VAIRLVAEDALRLSRPFAIGVCKDDMDTETLLVDVDVYVPATDGDLFGRWRPDVDGLDDDDEPVAVIMSDVHQLALSLIGEDLLAPDGRMTAACERELRLLYPGL